MFYIIFFIWVSSKVACFEDFESFSWHPSHFVPRINREFEQKTDKFWEFKEKSNTWVEVKLPIDLVSCVDRNCTKVCSINPSSKTKIEEGVEGEFDVIEESENGLKKKIEVLSMRKRVSLTKMSETSIWVTGQSGCIYERFWNGVQWVIAPHELPIWAGGAVSMLIVNQTILALSEDGILYQMQLSESSQPIWVEFTPTIDESTTREIDQNSRIQIQSGVVSNDGVRIYFCTKDGSLLELSEVDFPRWVNHGRPPGANVAAIADAATIKQEVVFTISSAGDLYEYDKSSKPSWKKHIWSEESAQDPSLKSTIGCSLHGLGGTHSISLFLVTKGGDLVERRLHQRKWKWIAHGSPEDGQLTSITSVTQEEWNENFFSLFFTTATGSVFEYRLPKHSGIDQEKHIRETWVNHTHPLHAKVARGIPGIHYGATRILFALDDGRLGELTHQVNTRRKSSLKYAWSILDAPESEGWNAEYCTEHRGPSNCMSGVKDTPYDAGRRKGKLAHQTYLYPGVTDNNPVNPSEEYNFPKNWINNNFHLRVMHSGQSLFLITDGGLTFEYLYAESVWLWLRHEHSTAMKGVLGNYNGSLFLVDEHGNLFMRERSIQGLVWINCTSMRRGRKVMSGPPWDGMPGKAMKTTAEDVLFFVGRSGRLLQFWVALRKFKWKDCRNPANTKVASIVDQESFRENVVFVIGGNGRLYQYNKITELWHEHYQSQHLVLLPVPGTAMRPSSHSLMGSLFMVSEEGALVEYHWNVMDGWNWVEHGTPYKSVTLVSSPGPCFRDNQLFFIGSDGEVYLRYFDQTWKWKSFGSPRLENMASEGKVHMGGNGRGGETCGNKDSVASFENYRGNQNGPHESCDSKVASIRPVPFTDDSIIFELRDGRLAEMRRIEETHWVWSRTTGTPTSLCMASYLTGVAS